MNHPGVPKRVLDTRDSIHLLQTETVPLSSSQFSPAPSPTDWVPKGNTERCLIKWNGSGSFLSSFLTCKLCRTFRKSFIPVRCSTSWKTATSRVGMMAIERVRITRAKRDHFRFRNPWKKTQKQDECLE